MKKKDFVITKTNAPKEGYPEQHQHMERFISNSEPQTTMTFHLPQRLKISLKREALNNNTTIKNLLIQILENTLLLNK